MPQFVPKPVYLLSFAGDSCFLSETVVVFIIYIFLFCRLVCRPKPLKYVVGVTEVASYLNSLSGSLAHSYSVCLYPNRFYDCKYDFALAFRSKYFAAFARYFIGPIILGKLVHHADVFIYLWKHRFLISSLDEGEFEFGFLKFLRKNSFLSFWGLTFGLLSLRAKWQDLEATKLRLIITFLRGLVLWRRDTRLP